MSSRALHIWDLSPREAREVQLRLAGKVVLRGRLPAPRLAAGVDVSYRRGDAEAYAAVVVVSLPDLATVEEAWAARAPAFPYVPGLLTFREGPIALAAIARLASRPDLFIFDGQGLAHPARFGLACHLGLILDRPSLGCAKSILVGTHGPLGPRRGDRADLVHEGETVGVALRTRDGVRPVYVSQGHRLDLAEAIRMVLATTRRYRLPEPIRRAHALSNRVRVTSRP